MTYLQTTLACLLFACVCSGIASPTIANGQFPTTQYQGFDTGSFATSSPAVPDPEPAIANQVSMSPDSWGAPANVGDLSEFQRNSVSPATSPSVPDLTGSGNYQPASIYGSQPIPMPGSSRYPLSNSNQEQPNASGAKPLSNSVVDGSTNGFDPTTPTNNLIENSTANDFHSLEGWYDPATPGQPRSVSGCDSCQAPIGFANPAYRPDLGHRNSAPTQRHGGRYDEGQQFDFENKKTQYPPMSEILATGRYFGSASTLYLKGHFQGNTAIATSGGGTGVGTPFDFDYEVAPQMRLGFESKYGPGIELNYWQYDETSNVASFTSDGSITGTTSSWMLGPSQWSQLQATAAGDQLDATHSIDVESIGVSFFKEIKFKISRINGMFGFQYVSVAQGLDATLTNGGAEIGRLTSRSDFRGYGPKFGMEYYRPVGHTKLELITAVGGSVLFGQRDQFVQNTVTNDLSRIGADEFVTTLEFMSGVQYKKMIAENRAYYARLGMTYQTWIGGGTAVDPQGDFGLRGISFAVGYNR